MKFFLFVITFTLSFNLSLRAAGIDTTRIYPLLAKVQKAPRKSEVDSLLMYMASPTNIRYADTIVKVFRPLFDSAQARPLLLAGLAKYRCLNFELQIGKLISGIIQPDGQVNNLLLIAIKKSGGNLCYDLLIRHCQDGIRSANAGVFESKKKIWKELFRRNMIGTLSAMIQYYAYDNIGQSEMARFPIHQLMNTFIDEIAGSPALFAEALPALQYFLLSGDSAFQRDPEVAYFGFEGQDKPYRFPSLFLGERGTARHAINTKIFEKLVAGKSVYSIAVAADFLRGDDADLRRRAANVDFAPITNTQTIPELFNLSNDSVITKAVFRDRKKLTHNYSNLYLYAPHYIRTRKLLGFTDNEGFFNADTSYSEVNHKKVRDLYRVSLAQTIRSVSERFEIKSLVFVDTVKQFIRNARGLLPIRNYDDNFFDFSILFNGLINAVATAVRKEGFSKDIADSTASIIVGKEFDRKAILAFSLSQIRGKINLRQWDINFGSIDSIFKVICTRHSSEMRVNSEISPSLLQRPSSQLAVSKTIQQVKVLERKFCFSDAMYFEKVQYKDENNVIKVVDWYGTIPVSLLIPLMKELHILDFTKYSFAVTEWTSQQSSMNFRQLIDYIRIDPISSCNYLFFSLNKSAVKDKDLEELIILNPYRMPTNWEMERVILRDFPSAKPYYRDTLLNKRPWFTKLDFGGKRSAESGFPSGIGNFLGNYVAKDTAEYSRHKSGYAQPLLQYLLTKIYRRYNEHILSYNINEVSETNPCHDVDIFCHAGIITNENKNRKWSIETGRSIVSDLQVAEQFMDAWNLAGYNLRPESKAFLRQCLISPDFKQYYSTYELGEGAGTKYVNIEGQLKDLPEELKVILTLYPNFLSDYNLDMAGALNNSMENFSTAISRHYNYRYGSFSTQRLFNTAGYGAIRFWAPRFVPKGIFFRSAEGKIIASELSFINQLFSYGLGKKIDNIGSPSVAFIAAVKEQGRVASEYVEGEAGRNAAQNIEAARAKKGGFNIHLGITVASDGSGSLSMEISTGAISFRFSTTTDFSTITFQAGYANTFQLQSTLNLGSFSSDGMPSHGISNNSIVTGSVTLTLLPQDFPALVNTSSLNITRINESFLPQTMNGTNALGKLPELWMELNPVIGPGPWTNSVMANNPAWLYGLISRAADKLNMAEKDLLLKAVRSGYFSEELVNILYERGDQALEATNIAAGQWISTRVLKSSLIPDEKNRNGLSESEYIKSFNNGEDDRFKKQIKSKQSDCAYKQVFEDGVPGVSLQYDSEFRNMMWTYRYKCVDGTIIQKNFINEVFPSIRALIAADPDGHVLEKLTTMIAEDFIGSPGGTNPLRKTEYKKIDDAKKYYDGLSEQYKDLVKNFKDVFQGKIKDFLDSFKKWQQDNLGKSAIENPFILGPDETPFINLFSPPWQWHLRRNELIEKRLDIQRRSQFIENIKMDEVHIKLFL